jgi:hypothetical protein
MCFKVNSKVRRPVSAAKKFVSQEIKRDGAAVCQMHKHQLITKPPLPFPPPFYKGKKAVE